MNLEKSRVEIYGNEKVISGQNTEISVYNVYRIGDKDLDETFHDSVYRFPEAGNQFLEELGDFRERCVLSWHGDRIYPIVTSFGDVAMSLSIPNSQVYEEPSEKSEAVNFTETVTDELEPFLTD